MKIVISGGSGQVGSILARAFIADGHEVVILSRYPGNAPWKVVNWDAQSLGDWTSELETADVLINLAGRNVNCRYHDANRGLIMESRVRSTQVIGEAIAQATQPPHLWLQASTATIYAHRFDAPNDDITGMIGGEEAHAPERWRFSIDVAKAWEQAAQEAIVPNTRKVLLRSAMTMSPDQGGVFDVLLRLVRWGLGGKNGNGKQYVSWLHDQDFVRAIYWLIEHEAMEGVVNLASPNPVPNEEFMRTLRRAWGRRFGLPAAAWMLEVGAFFLRTETELILKSRRVVPGRLQESGFEFSFPTWSAAAADLCARWRAGNARAA